MVRPFGLETEYGFWIEGLNPDRMVAESRAIVRAYEGPYAGPWAYGCEDPRRDMRGFTVAELARDPDDARFDNGKPAYASLAEEHSDRVLTNGARFYNDHGHPEFSTPECTSLLDLVAYDRAGDLTVLQCAAKRAAELKRAVTVYKNNTDYHGVSYGAHECCLARRDVPVDVLITGLTPFLATRQVFAGAGKTCIEGDGARAGAYQISQRADFIAVETSVDTLHRRPLFNTRDEPHAPAERFRRLHVISGDANMSQWAVAMKVGTLALVLDVLESCAPSLPVLADPVAAVRTVSRDTTLSAGLPLRSGGHATALDIQRAYLSAARSTDTDLPERDWVLAEWARVLDDIECDPSRGADRVDWIAKRAMLVPFMEAEGLDWSSPVVQSLDLAYHNISPADGLQRALEQEGAMMRVVSDEDIARAETEAPITTRACIRGHFARRHAAAVRAISWSTVTFDDGADEMSFDLGPLLGDGLAETNKELSICCDLAGTMSVLRRYRSV